MAHTDGHPVLSQTYHVFLNVGEDSNQHLQQQNNVPDDFSHPHYYGKIIFEQPGKVFSYLDADLRLIRSEIEEVINCITEMRDKPHLWKSL